MELRFGTQAIEDWAQLSGDRNPIHFDREAAGRMDAPDVVVHGMLALLPVKQWLSRTATTDGEQWLQFKALLKAPVLRDIPVQLKVSTRNDRTTFKLLPATGTAEHVVGNMRGVDKPIWSSAAPRHTFPIEDTEVWLHQFRRGLGQGYDDWVTLDAMVFGDFIRHRIGTVFAQLGSEPHLRQPQIESLTSHLLLQTSHRIVFCDSLRVSGDLSPTIDYQIDNFDLIENPSEAVGTLDLGVHMQGRHVMTITLGLMIRKLPTQ